MPSPEQLAGPTGAIIALIAVLGIAARVIQVLWSDHLRADADDRTQRDTAIAGWREQTAATNRLAEAIEQRNARDARAKRSQDPAR